MKLKKEIYILGMIFVFIFGYFLGINNSPKEIVEVEKKEKIQGENLENIKTYKVWEVIDGDTIKIDYEGKRTSVRIIGINTPEKTGPYRKAECFGVEASKKAKELLWSKKITVETDPSQSKFDSHGRLLAYIGFLDGSDFGEKMIKTGYAYENTYRGSKYKNQNIYKNAQEYAEENSLGLWSKETCNGQK